MAIQIRQATEADAVDAIITLRRSITELCVADHRNDPAEIERWLGNKTEDAWRNWIVQDDAVVLVAERDGKIVGVGMATLSGDIMLNYAHPEARFSGVSKVLLTGIETALRSHGVQHCRLESTITARSFYESCGFRPAAGNALVLFKPL
jgi:N-acetylglutamate synthase-like GNAT family acetyltransferase